MSRFLRVGEFSARLAWDGLEDEIRAEIGPQIASLVTEAFRRRLPWTWKPEA
jgi:hypothetical protein